MSTEPTNSRHNSAIRDKLPQASVRVHRHLAMGTEFCLYLEWPVTEMQEAEERTLLQAVFAEVDRVEAIFSRFRASSEIARLNRLAAEGPVVTDPEVFSLLFEAKRLWEKSGGAFDVALGRLGRAWGFADRSPHMPAPDELAEAEAAAGMALVVLDPEWRTVEFLRPGVELDLGAFAKGYAVDCALGVLRGAGVSGLIDAGHSSLAAVGEPFENGWKTEVRVPMPHGTDGRLLDAIPLGCRAMGSSGIMEQKFEAEGCVVSHLFDPRRGGGEERRRQMLQTTVLAETAAQADALSTALFVLGPEEGRAVAGIFENCAALWIFKEGDTQHTAEYNWPGALSA